MKRHILCPDKVQFRFHILEQTEMKQFSQPEIKRI